MMADVDAYDADIARMAKIETFESEQRSAGRPPRAGFGPSNDAAENKEIEKRNLLHYMRTGEVRDLSTGAGSGAPLVPTGYLNTLTEAAKLWGQLASSVKQLPTSTGEPLRVPFANDTANAFTLLGESQPVTELDPSLTGITSQVDKYQSGLVKVSKELLQDSAFDLDSWLTGEFGKRYWRGISAAVRNGSSTGNIAAITSVAVAGITTASPTAIVYGEMAEMYGALEAAYIPNASWVMNSATRAYFLGVTDTLGRPIYTPNANSDQFDRILGLPIVIDQFSDSIAATKVPVLLGSLTDAYTLRTAGGVEVVRLNERYADTFEVAFLAMARVGGFGTDAGTHPLIKLAMHA